MNEDIQFDRITNPVRDGRGGVQYIAHRRGEPFVAGASIGALLKLGAKEEGICDPNDPAHDRARSLVQAKFERTGATGDSCYIDEDDV